MDNISLVFSAKRASVRCLVDLIYEIKSFDALAQVTVMVDSEPIVSRVKSAIRSLYLNDVPSLAGNQAALLNVRFLTFDTLIRELSEQNKLEPNKSFLSDFALWRAAWVMEKNSSAPRPYAKFAIDLYKYIRYHDKSNVVDSITANFSLGEIKEYVRLLHGAIGQRYVDKLDILEKLADMAPLVVDQITSFLPDVLIRFLPQKLDYLEDVFFRQLLTVGNRSLFGQKVNSTLSDQGRVSTTKNQAEIAMARLQVICTPAYQDYYLANSYFGATDSKSFYDLDKHEIRHSPEESDLSDQSHDLAGEALANSNLSQNQGGKFSPKKPDEIMENKSEIEKPEKVEATRIVAAESLNVRREVKEALWWLLDEIAAGVKPERCAILYFGGDRYKESLLYETAALPLNFNMEDFAISKKNIFLELSKILFEINKKYLLATEILRTLSLIFSLSKDGHKYKPAAIMDKVLAIKVEIGSIEFWSYAAKTRMDQTGDMYAQKVTAILEVIGEYLAKRDVINNISSVISWLSAFFVDLDLILNEVDSGYVSNEYIVFKKMLFELDGVFGSSQLDNDDIVASLNHVNISNEYSPGGIYVAPVETANCFDLDAVAVLGCSGVLDKKSPDRNYQQLLENVISQSAIVRFSSHIHRSGSKEKEAMAQLVKDLLPDRTQISFSEASGKVVTYTKDREIPLISYGDLADFFVRNNYIAKDQAEPEKLVITPSLLYSLRSLSGRRSNLFNAYSGHATHLPLPAVTYSPTALEEYQICPFRYFLHRTLKVESHGRALATGVDKNTVGLVIHKVLEVYIKLLAQSDPYRSYSFDFLAAEIKKYDPSLALADIEKLADRYDQENIDIYSATVLQAVIDIEFGQIYKNTNYALTAALRALQQKWTYHLMFWHASYMEILSKGRSTLEAEWQFSRQPIFSDDQSTEVNSILFSGLVDRIDVDQDDNLYIVDYKTGSPDNYQKLKGSAGITPGFLQLPLYGAAYLQSRQFDRCYGSYEFIAYPEKDISIVIDKDLINELETVVKTIDDLIVKGVFPQNPGDPSQATFTNCRSCSYLDTCSDFERRRWQEIKKDPKLANYVEISK